MGKSAANIPNTQIRLKTRPSRGFRQRKSSRLIGGLTASKSTMAKPKIETVIPKIKNWKWDIRGMYRSLKTLSKLFNKKFLYVHA